MNNDVLDQLPLDVLTQRLQRAFSVTTSVALADSQGRLIERLGDINRAKQSHIAALIRQCDLSALAQTTEFITQEKCLLLMRSVDINGASFCFLMLAEFHSNTYCSTCELVNAALDIAFEEALNALMLNAELNEMADDLSARYEELNLFYGLDDIVENQDAGSGREALRKLGESCAKYLNMDVVAIRVMPADIMLEAHGLCSREFLRQWQGCANTLVAKLASRLTGRNEAVIINDTQEVQQLCAGNMTAKIAMSPIYAINGTLLGVILMGRAAHSEDFSNSDRRSLRVVAEHAATIVSASYDVLTGLLNREGLLAVINRALYTDTDEKCLLFMDLDQFKVINDSCGRTAGDELLSMIATQIRNCVPDNVYSARIESDKFGMLVPNQKDRDAWTVANDILREIAARGFRWDGKLFDVSAGVGIVRLSESVVDADEVMALGAIACDVAKQQGRHSIFTYKSDSAAIESVRSSIDWVPLIRSALESNAFELYAQQIIPLHEVKGDKLYYEMLLRLCTDNGVAGSPFQMIKVAESYNPVSSIDEWVITHTLEALKRCHQRYPQLEVCCSVNMSGQSVTDDFFFWLKKLLLENPELIPRLTFEITETNVVSNLTTAIRLIESLRSIGIKFSLDDFGSGMSSFGYLRDLPVDTLKIDGAFVKHVDEDPISLAMVESIHRIGHLMGLKTVAEFVENDVIAEKLKKIGVDYGQGYGLNKPGPFFQQIETLLAQRNAEETQALTTDTTLTQRSA